MSNLNLPWHKKIIFSCPVTCYLGVETNLATLSREVVVGDKISSEPSFLQAKQLQVPQPLLIRLELQILPQLCAFLDTFQHINVLL